MRILAACSLGGAGHLQPLLPLLDAALEQGHETLVIAPSGLQEMTARTGHAFVAGGEPPESVIGPIREKLPIVPAGEAAVLGNRELFGRHATAAMLPAMEEVLTRWRPDLILRDPCEFASAVAAGPAGIPVAQVAIGMADVERDAIDLVRPVLEGYRAGLAERVLADPYLTRFPASLDRSPFVDTRRFRESGPASLAPLPDWWSGSTAPLVYLTFGTVLGYMSIAASVYGAALDAVAGLDVRVLLTVGRKFDASQLKAVPPNVHVEAWVDQSRVLPEAQLVVCHGGSGTTYAALGAGTPVVIVPSFSDQFVNGERVTGAGAGLVVATEAPADGQRRPPGPKESPRIREAIQAVLTDTAYRSAAQQIGAEMAATPGPDEVLAGLLGS